MVLTTLAGGVAASIVGQRLERSALDYEAWSVSETVGQVLGPAIAGSDFEASDHVKRASEIAQAAEDIVDPRIREVRIWSADGTLVFGPDLGMVGLEYRRGAELVRALQGEIASVPVLVPTVTSEERDEGLQTFAPIRARDGSVLGAYEIQHGTSALKERVHEELLMLWLGVIGALLVLYAGLLGIVRRASKELEWRHREVADLSSRRDKDRMKTEFASTVSHELRVPLTSLIGYSELLLSRGPHSGQARHWATLIHQQSERLKELLDDVLSASMIEESAVTLMPRTMDLPNVVARAIAALPEVAPTITIEVDFPPGLPPIMADPDKLLQILTNVLTNAVKYSPEGGEIRVSGAVVNGRLRLSVVDHGLGIGSDDLPRLFQRFYRLHSRSNPNIGGTGLGLYISRGLAELQGGTLWAESQGPGLGSTFHLELPLAPSPDGSAAPVARPRLAVGGVQVTSAEIALR
jgi:signal transduction histidine kinase